MVSTCGPSGLSLFVYHSVLQNSNRILLSLRVDGDLEPSPEHIDVKEDLDTGEQPEAGLKLKFQLKAREERML